MGHSESPFLEAKVNTVTKREIEIEPFDAEEATEVEWAAVNEFRNVMQRERFPDDPPESVARTRSLFLPLPTHLEIRRWAAWHTDGHGEKRVVGYARAVFILEDNLHLCDFGIDVLSAFRRQGIGARMLALISEEAQRRGRTLLVTSTVAAIPAGEEFMKRMDAQMALESHVNQLDLSDLNRELLQEWQSRAAERASEFELGGWDGPYPEESLADIAALKEAMNLAPRGDLQMEDIRVTPEYLRRAEELMAARGTERWCLYARHTPSGELAGYTEVFWSPDRPTIIQQEDTAVWPKYRNNGLGRWLKAAMLDRVLRERPQARLVRTGNADSNAAMLNINYQLGFRPYLAEKSWQIEVEKALRWCEGRQL
jgi:mycothiol synthase